MDEVIASFAVQTPFEFDAGTAQSDMPDFLEAEWDVFGTDREAVVNLVGRDLNFARDLLISLTKFCHLLGCVKAEKQRGALTWAVVDAYHAAMLGARSLAAFYGVLTYGVNNRTVLIDYRPDLGSKDDQKRFFREFRGIADPIKVLRPEKEKLEQKESWEMLVRFSNINSSDKVGEEWKTAAKLAVHAKKPLSAVRNRVLYDTVYWVRRDDFQAVDAAVSPLVQDDQIGILLEALKEIRLANLTFATKLCERLDVPLSLFEMMSEPIEVLG